MPTTTEQKVPDGFFAQLLSNQHFERNMPEYYTLKKTYTALRTTYDAQRNLLGVQEREQEMQKLIALKRLLEVHDFLRKHIDFPTTFTWKAQSVSRGNLPIRYVHLPQEIPNLYYYFTDMWHREDGGTSDYDAQELALSAENAVIVYRNAFYANVRKVAKANSAHERICGFSPTITEVPGDTPLRTYTPPQEHTTQLESLEDWTLWVCQKLAIVGKILLFSLATMLIIPLIIWVVYSATHPKGA